jgi:streptogramin lyase
MKVSVAFACGLLTAGTMLAPAPAQAAANHPIGLVRELPVREVSEIGAGPEGNLWFTQNPRGKKRSAIGRITPAGKVTKFTLGKGVRPSWITTGPDGNLWFTFDSGGPFPNGGGVGRITPHGQVTLFPDLPGLHGVPFEIVTGPDGNLWFSHSGLLSPTDQAIGRITPSGEVSAFSAGLSEKTEVSNLTAGPGGVWFADESDNPAIGRITPAGQITEFPGLPPHPFPIMAGPVPGSEGSLWFADNGSKPPPVERIAPTGTIERFAAGLDPRAEYVGPFAVGSDGNAWFSVEKRSLIRSGRPKPGSAAIGRIAPSGQITEFSKCLRPLTSFAGPDSLVRGPDGNVWFATGTTAEPGKATRASTPSIGRITPSGEITEFRLGLHPASEPDRLVSAGGRIWFIDNDEFGIGMIAPPSQPANTFLVLRPRSIHGGEGARLRVSLPGPGRVKAFGGGIRALTTTAPSCGSASLEVLPGPWLRKSLRAGNTERVRVRVTYTPRGGSPFSQIVPVLLRSR